MGYIKENLINDNFVGKVTTYKPLSVTCEESTRPCYNGIMNEHELVIKLKTTYKLHSAFSNGSEIEYQSRKHAIGLIEIELYSDFLKDLARLQHAIEHQDFSNSSVMVESIINKIKGK